MSNERLQRQSAAVKTGGAFYKPQDGENRLRFFKFTHVVTDGDFKLGRFDEGDHCPPGTRIEELFCAYRKHIKPDNAVCGKIQKIDGRSAGECATCERSDRLQNSPDKADKDAGRNLKAATKFAVHIVDLNDPERRIQVWDAPVSIQMELANKLKASIYQGVEVCGVSGRDLIVTYNSKSQDPRGFYGLLIAESGQTRPLAVAELKGEIRDLYQVRGYVPQAFQCYLDGAAPAATRPAPAPAPAPVAAPTAPAAAQPVAAPAAPAEAKKPRGRPRKAPEAAPAAAPPKDWTGETVRFRLDEHDPQSAVLSGKVGDRVDSPDQKVWEVTTGDDVYDVHEREFLPNV